MSTCANLETSQFASPSEKIIERIADYEGIDATEVSPTLYEAVEPEALDNLVSSANDDVRVQFTYCGYEVTVRGDGDVTVTPFE